MSSIQGGFIPGPRIGGGATFNPMKAEKKNLDFPAVKTPGSPTEIANFRFSAQLAWMGII